MHIMMVLLSIHRKANTRKNQETKIGKSIMTNIRGFIPLQGLSSSPRGTGFIRVQTGYICMRTGYIHTQMKPVLHVDKANPHANEASPHADEASAHADESSPAEAFSPFI